MSDYRSSPSLLCSSTKVRPSCSHQVENPDECVTNPVFAQADGDPHPRNNDRKQTVKKITNVMKKCFQLKETVTTEAQKKLLIVPRWEQLMMIRKRNLGRTLPLEAAPGYSTWAPSVGLSSPFSDNQRVVVYANCPRLFTFSLSCE